MLHEKTNNNYVQQVVQFAVPCNSHPRDSSASSVLNLRSSSSSAFQRLGTENMNVRLDIGFDEDWPAHIGFSMVLQEIPVTNGNHLQVAISTNIETQNKIHIINAQGLLALFN